MDSCCGSWTGQSEMELQIRLDREIPIYTNQDAVSGEVILYTESAISVSTINATLSGTATSRLNSGKATEVHHLFNRAQQVFPPERFMQNIDYSSLTVGCGRHVFPFSIPFPQVSECYKPGMSKSRSKARSWRRPTVHLLRKLPPSTGQLGDAAEINYFIVVTISGRNIPNELKSSTRDIFFYPLSELMPHQEPLKEQQSMPVSPRALDCPEPLSYQIDMHLLHGPCLILHQPIPLTITITKIGDPNCLICLNDFQTMLVETTQVQARGLTESFTRFWIVQSTANMNIGIDMDNAPSGSMITLPDGLWASQPLPAMLTPSFEICNIKRRYKLQVRLGLRLGLVRYQTLVRDFHFPVYVMAPNSTSFRSYEREPSIDLIDFK